MSKPKDFVFVKNLTRESIIQNKLKVSKLDIVKNIALVEIIRDKENMIDLAILKISMKLKKNEIPDIQISSKENDIISVIGHPQGLPLMKSLGNRLHVKDNIIYAKIDTFKGNSGSPALNNRGEVIGMLIKGSKDYTRNVQRSCLQLKYNSSDLKNKNEKILKIETIYRYLKDSMRK